MRSYGTFTGDVRRSYRLAAMTVRRKRSTMSFLSLPDGFMAAVLLWQWGPHHGAGTEAVTLKTADVWQCFSLTTIQDCLKINNKYTQILHYRCERDQTFMSFHAPHDRAAIIVPIHVRRPHGIASVIAKKTQKFKFSTEILRFQWCKESTVFYEQTMVSCSGGAVFTPGSYQLPLHTHRTRAVSTGRVGA